MHAMQLMCVTSSLFKLKQVETCKDAFAALLADGSAFSC